MEKLKRDPLSCTRSQRGVVHVLSKQTRKEFGNVLSSSPSCQSAFKQGRVDSTHTAHTTLNRMLSSTMQCLLPSMTLEVSPPFRISCFGILIWRTFSLRCEGWFLWSHWMFSSFICSLERRCGLREDCVDPSAICNHMRARRL